MSRYTPLLCGRLCCKTVCSFRRRPASLALSLVVQPEAVSAVRVVMAATTVTLTTSAHNDTCGGPAMKGVLYASGNPAALHFRIEAKIMDSWRAMI